MAIAGAPTPSVGVVRPEARIETTSLPRRTVEVAGVWGEGGRRGTGGCALDEAAAGESVLRILEVMSRAVLYNTRSRPFQSRPLSAFPFRLPPRPAAAVAPLPPYYRDPDEKWK